MVDLNLIQAGNVWKHLGMEIYNSPKGAGVRIRNAENLRQLYGNIHGGIVATAVDAAAAVAVNTCIGPDKGATTVEMKVNYLLPVASDIYAYAKVVKQGKQLVVTSVEVFDDNDNLVSVGIVTYMVRSLEKKG